MMFVDGAVCDIYVGKAAGNSILKDLKNARHSVKIVSPFLSPKLLLLLKKLHAKGVEVALVSLAPEAEKTTAKSSLFTPLITSKSIIPGISPIIAAGMHWILLTALVILTIGLYITGDSKLAFLTPLGFLIVYALLRGIYPKQVSFLFPTKLLDNKHINRLHTKFYIIDDRVAYLGSLNFTQSGLFNNHESRIRTRDPKVLESLSDEFDRLMQS